MNWGWVALITAGVSEVIWLYFTKLAEGWTLFWPTVGVMIVMPISTVLLGYSAKTIPVGTAYSVWTGIGAFGGALMGMILFGESASPLRIAAIFMIIVGIIILKLFESA